MLSKDPLKHRLIRPICSLSAGLLFLLLPLACTGLSTDRPNVLLIIVDTLRMDRLECYGARTVETPASSALSREGIRFENAITPAPYTLPSICSILTGLYPYRHQVRDNEMNLHESLTTLAEVFREAGYRTGAVVGSAVLARERNLAQGFDHYDDDFPDSLPVYGKKYRELNMRLGSRAQRRAGDVTTRALEWIREERDGPFFLFAHYFDPHTLYDPPPPYDSLYATTPYEGEVAYTDEQVGRLLDGLDDAGLREKTMVVFVADHGEGLGDHEEAGHGFFLYETTVRVPLIIAWPGMLPENRVISDLVNTMDIAPTVAEIAGLGFQQEIDARSLLPLIHEAAFPSEPIYTEALLGYSGYGWSPLRGIRTDAWKYVHAPTRELYHLPSDPDEISNLYEEKHAVAESLGSILREHRKKEAGIELLPVELADVTEEQRDRLEALGYVHLGGKDLPSMDEALPDPKDAIKDLNRRWHAQAEAGLAIPLIARGEYDRASKHLNVAIELDPDNTTVIENLARIHLLSREFEEAERLFRRLTDLDPNEVEHKANLAGSLAGQGRIDEAIALLEKCAALDPTKKEYRDALRSLGEDARVRRTGR